ncbi:MAG: DUF899 domain-containing protein [Ilumatobacteraceae bacterium]
MVQHRIATRAEWEAERIALLAKEKELTRRADALALERQALPWVRLEHDYVFDTEFGSRTLKDLFENRTQLIVYHFMLGDGWEAGCPSCSFWADNFDGIGMHLAARDVTFMAASIAPLKQILAFRDRMEWSFPWISTAGTTFNLDFEVSGSTRHNYRQTTTPIGESPGVSAFALEDGVVYHTYSSFQRGLEVFNGAYHLLDIAPRGRDESGPDGKMDWVRHHDSYN